MQVYAHHSEPHHDHGPADGDESLVPLDLCGSLCRQAHLLAFSAVVARKACSDDGDHIASGAHQHELRSADVVDSMTLKFLSNTSSNMSGWVVERNRSWLQRVQSDQCLREATSQSQSAHLAAAVLVKPLSVALQPRKEGHGSGVEDGRIHQRCHVEHEDVRGDGAGAVKLPLQSTCMQLPA